jgi:hypothetical protein
MRTTKQANPKSAKAKTKPANASKNATMSSLHDKTHKVLAETLGAMAAVASSNVLQATQARLILLLESYGRKNPVRPTTPVSSAVWSLDTLGRDINNRWDFPPEKAYRQGDINGNWPTYTLAQDIDNNGGVPNGT